MLRSTSRLVLFGLGATVAAALSAAPWLVVLSHHKHWVFLISGALIAGNFIYAFRPAAACDPESPEACRDVTRVSKVIPWISGTLYAIGFFTAYVLGPVLMRF